MKRKWQRVLSWILTLTMLLGTFQGTGFSVFAGDDEDVIISENDSELVGDPEDIEEPEEGDDLDVTNLTIDFPSAVEDWGIWDATNKKLTVYPGSPVIASFHFDATITDPTVYADLEWKVSYNNGAFATLSGTTEYDTNEGFKFAAVSTNRSVQMSGTPTADNIQEDVPVTISVNDATSYKDYTFYVTVADIDRDLYVSANASQHVEGVWAWTNMSYPTISNKDGQGILAAQVGRVIDGEIDFRAYKGPESKKAEDVRKQYTNIEWQLWSSVKDGDGFVLGEPIFTVTSGKEESFYGLRFKHLNGEGTEGLLRINGTPDKTLDQTVFFLRAHSLDDNDKTTAQEWADFALAMEIIALDPSVQIKEDKADAAWSAAWTYENPSISLNIPFKTARTGYTVEESSNPNAVNSLKYVLANTSTVMDITNASLSLVKHPDATVDESGMFTLTYDFNLMEKGGKSNAVYKFSVAPKPGLVARPEAYKAAVVLNGDQLPSEGIIVAKLSFKVDPVFEMKVNGESRELTAVTATDPFYEAGTNKYFFDVNTYEAGKNIVNGITFNVVSKEAGKTVWFLPYNEGGTVLEDLPAGLVLGSAGTDTMKITGYLDPTTWIEKSAAAWTKTVKPYFVLDALTNNVIYYIPFPVIDSDENVITYIGRLTVEPCDITLALGNKGGKLVDTDIKNASTTWYAAQNYKSEDAVQEIKITNNGDKKITLTAYNTNLGENLKLLKAADSKPYKFNENIDPNEGNNYGWELDPEALAEGGKVTIEIEAGASGSWYVVPVSGNATPKEGSLIIKGYETGNTDIQIDTLSIGLTFKVYEGFTIVAPEGENAEQTGKTYATRRVIKLGIGESKSWDLKAVGNTGDVIWSTTPKGTDIGSGDVAGGHKVGEKDEDYRATTSELANDYNFSVNPSGLIRCTGAEKEGTFTLCIAAKDNNTTIYSYYEFQISASDEILTATVPDETLGTKVLKSAVAEIGRTHYSDFAEARNLTMKTSEDGIQTLTAVVTLTNSGKIDLTNVVATMGDAYKDDPNAKITAAEKNPFTAFPEVGNLIKIGTIAADGGTATFEVVIKALHFNEVEAGKYLVPVKLTSDQTVDQQFEVLLTVTKAPVINPVKTDAEKTTDAENKFVSDATTLSYLFNETELAKAELADRSNPDRTVMAPFVANLNNTTSNILIGQKVAVGQEFSVQLTARDVNGKLFKKGEASFDWFETLESDFKIPSSIKLSKDGLIEGKPLVAGTYYMTVRVQDVRNTAEITEGYYDICIYVPGAANAQVTINDIDVKNTDAVKDYLTFKGAVKGDTIDSTFSKSFIVKNKTKDVAVAGLKVEVKDDPSLPGGKSHFEATLSANAIASGGDKFTGLTVTPKDTTTAGVYKAIVVVTADNINPIEIPVFWVVTERLVFVRPDASETITRTGMEPFTLRFKATGAGNYYKLVEEEEFLQVTDKEWYTSKVKGLDLEQYAVWSIGASEGHADDSELKAMLKGLRECGFNPAQLKDEKIKNKRINIARDENIAEYGSLMNFLHSFQLTGGGTYSMEVFVTVDAVKNSVGTVVLPAQERSEVITLTITPTDDVYAKVTDTAAWNGSVTDTATVREHYDISGSTHPEARLIEEYKKDLGFDFRGMPEGYTADERPTVKFTINNEIASKLRIKASVVSANKTDASSAFVIVDGDKEVTTLEGPAEGTDSYWNLPTAYGEENWHQGEKTYTVKIAKDLPASETPYEGYLLIEGTGIQTIELPLSVVVSNKNYKIGVYAYQTLSETGDLQGEGVAFDSRPINASKQTEGQPSEVIGYLNVFGVGNMNAKAKRIVELDEKGNEIGLGGDTKLDYTFLSAAGLIKEQNSLIKVATDVNEPSIDIDEHSVIKLRVNVNEDKNNKAIADTVSMNIYYEDPASPSSTKENYVTVVVNYVIYNNPIEAEITPEGANINVSEGYDVSENSVEFTLTNKAEGDASNGIYQLDVSLVPSDLFNIVTTHKESDVVLPGNFAKFTVEPIENIPAGEYPVTVTFKADNMEKQTREILFKVTKSDTFSTYFTQDGWTLEGGFKTRVFNTLDALETQYGASTVYEVQKFNDTYLFDDNVDLKISTPKGYYLIDFNDNGKTWDVAVYEDQYDILTVRKVNYGEINNKNYCNVVKYSSSLTYDKYTAANNTFKTMNFNLLEEVIEDGYELDGSYGVIIDGVDYGYVDYAKRTTTYKDFFEKFGDYIWGRYIYAKFLVPYNAKLNTAAKHVSYISAIENNARYDYGLDYIDIAYYQKDTFFEGWNNAYHENDVEDNHLVKADTIIIEDKYTKPQWHTHKFYQEEDNMTVIGNVDQYVEWNWEGSKEEGFTGAKVTLYCWDPNGCPDPERGAKTLTAIVTPVKVDGTCTTGGHTEYRAEAKIPNTDLGYNGVLYVSENKARYEEGGYGHVYEYNWDKVVWYNTDGKMEDVYATVVKTCKSNFHRIDEDGDYAVTVSTNNIEFFGKKATCSENGSGYYHATFDFDDIPAADVAAGKNVVSVNAPVVLATGHKWAVVSADWVGDYKQGAKSVTMHLVCENDEEHKFDLEVTDDSITLIEETETSKTYRALGEKDGQALTAEVTYSSHTEHNWIVSWNWAAFDGKAGTGTVDVTFTCTHPDGGEVITKEGLVPEKVTATDYSATYKVTTQDPDGVEVSDSKTFNLESGEEIRHEVHQWAEPIWDWSGTGRTSAKAKATFNCTVVSENHSVVVEAKPEDITRKEVGKNKVVYTATVSGPDAKNYTSKCTVKWTVNDDGTISENIIPGGSATGIGIEGLDPDDEFEFTGNAIKPVFQVVDYDRDVVLAETTDYTLKWKDNKKVGTATVTVEGKGNYTGKTVSTTFKIVAPDTTADEIVTSVKSVKVSKDKFVYDGTAKYPATITVKTKDAGTIVLTYKDGEYESSVDGKTVALTFSNNVNKGKATVAATGKDGKTKKKTFSIAAADLKTLGDALTMEAGNGVYAVKAPVPSSLDVEYNDMTLVLGQDFKATYAYANKKSKNAGEKAGLVKITGKGNYKGKVEVLFDVDAFELEDEKVAVAAAPKAKSAKLKASVADANGVLIPAKQLVVTCVGSKGKKLAAGEEIEVTVKGANESNISGEVKLSIKVGAADLKKAKVTGLSGKSKYTVEYTGTPIDFEEMEENPFESGKIALTGYIYGEDYEIAGYLNNNKKGTMTVILRGISEKVSGVKTLKIKVTAKQMKPAE